MQYDPSKPGFNNYGNAYGNQYTPMSQPPYGVGTGYAPNVSPPPSYPQQYGYPTPGTAYPGSQPMQPQYVVSTTPVIRPTWWSNILATPITSNIRIFLVISGIFYIIWAVLAFGIEVGIIITSAWRYYTGIWSGSVLLVGGITMLVASCRTSFVMARLIQLFSICLFLCILGGILSVINLTRSTFCNSTYYWFYCDDDVAHHLKIAIIVFYVVASIHSIINIIVSSNAQRAGATASTSYPQ